MKLLAAALAPASSFFVSFADATVLRLRGGGGNHTQIEHHTHHTKKETCDGACEFATLFGSDMCTYDFWGQGMGDVSCSGCEKCKTGLASQTTQEGVKKEVKIRYRTGRYSGGRLGNDIQAFVDAIKGSDGGQGYCEANLTEASWSNQGTCRENGGKKDNIAFQVTVEFDNYIGSNWNFNFGVDFGWGGVIYMDGKMMRAYDGDIWWSMKEDHANDLGFEAFVPAGRHNLTVYGAEGCCDGPSRIKFCANCEEPTNMAVLSIANVETAVDHFMELGSFSPTAVNQFHAFTAEFETPPVVVVKGGASGQIQVIDVTKTGFSTKGTSPDTDNVTDTVFLAVEPGAHTLPDGRIISAGTTNWKHPYNDHTMGVGHDYGHTSPAFEVTWLGSPLESAAPGVTSQLSPTEARLSQAQPAAEWRPSTVDLSAVRGRVETLGYVAMGKGEGSFTAKGGKIVTYVNTETLFNWTGTSFVV